MTEQDEERKVVVEIFGEEYPITGAGDPAHISKIARIVDTRMRQVAKSTRTKGRDKVAILTAMSFASELDEKSEELDSTQSISANRLDRLLSGLDRVLADESAAHFS
jgi:cell division protein ZapA